MQGEQRGRATGNKTPGAAGDGGGGPCALISGGHCLVACQDSLIAKAKAEGKYEGRAPTARAKVLRLHEGIGPTEIAKRLRISYRALGRRSLARKVQQKVLRQRRRHCPFVRS